MRVSDLVRQFIIDNVATTYKGAAIWREDQYPFNNSGDKIILTRQSGRSVDAMIREFDVDVMMFCAVNSGGAELSALYDDAENALSYMKDNFIVNEDLKLTITQDVTGPYQTGQNRFYYRFSFLAYTE
jgi:hypothetical protein